MDADKSKGKEKVRSRESLSQGLVLTYKRRRLPKPETKPRDVPEQQISHDFWKSRGKAWEHSITIDENRQHWKCRYCSKTGNSGSVTGLKRHLVGDMEVKQCPHVPKDVSGEIKKDMDTKRERRKKRVAEKVGNSFKNRSSSDNTKAKMDPLPPDSDKLTRIDTHVLDKVTDKTNTGHQQLAHEVGRDKGSGDGKKRLELTLVTSSEPKNLIGLNTFIPSTSHDLIQLRRPDYIEVSGIQNCSTCNQCGKEAGGGRTCKICGDPEDEDKRFLICGYSLCSYKYYHIRCLKSKQIASDAQRDKPCWYCPSCLCRVCHSDKDDDQVIMCNGCDEGYHLYCLTPPLTSVPKGEWYCSSCIVERPKEGMRKYEQRMLKLHRKDDPMLLPGFQKKKKGDTKLKNARVKEQVLTLTE